MKKRVTVFPRIIDPDQQKKAGVLVLNGKMERYVECSDRRGHLLTFLCSIVTVNEHL